jgi:hypothetical protein
MSLADAIANGLVTVLNGVWSVLDLAISPITFILLLLGGAFGWLALLEFDELDRQATKPTIGLGQ